MSADKLFDDTIPARCEYCEFARRSGESLLCAKSAGEQAIKPCRRYRYDPLKRVPRQEARLPEYPLESFRID